MLTVILLISVFTLIYAYFKWTYQSWERKKVPFIVPQIPFGNLPSPLRRKENLAVTLKKYYADMKKNGWRFGGLYFSLTPILMPTDLDLVKNVMTKDFSHFTDRGVYVNEEDDPLSAHLFAIGGAKWRNLRTKLTPTFTSGKMKMMFQTLLDCEVNLQKKMMSEGRKPIDIKEILSCFTTDIIASCAFGLDLKTVQEDHSPFRYYGKKVFVTDKVRLLKFTFLQTVPNLAKKLRLTLTPKDVSSFFIDVVKDTVSYREKNNITRNDFLQLLINIKNEENEDNQKSLTIEEIAAQCFVFFLAGFETSSTTMTFALYELSKNQELQDKVRAEINEVLAKYEGQITYEAIQDMKYMNQVIDETLRKYPPVPIITRSCIKDYQIPETKITIEKGTRIFLPILGIHYDSEYYPDPEKFDPDRFNEENVSRRHHYAHIPFGEGPRICIGMRFGLMQSKVGLTSLLRSYRFTTNEKTVEPLKMRVDSFILAAEGEVWLNAEKI